MTEGRTPGRCSMLWTARQKLSAEVARIRGVLGSIVAVGPAQANVLVVGDFNDGPFKDLLENEFLIKSILDELVGSFLEPNTYFKHAMDPFRPGVSQQHPFFRPFAGRAIGGRTDRPHPGLARNLEWPGRLRHQDGKLPGGGGRLEDGRGRKPGSFTRESTQRPHACVCRD